MYKGMERTTIRFKVNSRARIVIKSEVGIELLSLMLCCIMACFRDIAMLSVMSRTTVRLKRFGFRLMLGLELAVSLGFKLQVTQRICLGLW